MTVGLGTIGLAAVVAPGLVPSITGPSTVDRPLLGQAQHAELRITVTERGNVESQVTVDGICELNGNQNKIVFLVPEGAKVKKGDIVCKFDDGEIQKNLAQQDIKVKQAVSKIETTKQEMEIQRNKGESDIIAATVELTLARLDLKKYLNGDAKAEEAKLKGEINLKKKDLDEAKNKLESYRNMMKKGLKAPEQVRIQEADVARATFMHVSAGFDLEKQKYDFERKTTEFRAKVDQGEAKVAQAKATAKAQVAKAESEYQAAAATADIEQQQLKEFNRQKELTILKAGQDGIVAYANDRYWDESSRIREGATVWPRQKIFSLPDMARMQVKVNIHESLVKKIKAGQKAEIRIDAFPNVLFIGTVKSVSQLADSTRPWLSNGVKEYPAVVNVDDLNGQEVKPGMTAEVKILVGALQDVLCVPIQAVAEHKGEFFAYVSTPNGIQRKRVRIGESNETHIQIIDGLEPGDLVALNARKRIAAEFQVTEAKSTESVKSPTESAPGNSR
jgi:RND family efflux transporter MFP subunit